LLNITTISPFLPPSQLDIAPTQVECLTEAIYHEARGEKYEGQAAVAQVVFNRVQYSGSEWGKSICGVVYQPGQFTWTVSEPRTKRTHHRSTDYREIQVRAWQFALSRKAGVIFADPDVESATFFSVGGFRQRNLAFNKQIGNHKFYSLIAEL